MSERTRRILLIAGAVILAAGIIGLMYPMVSSHISARRQQSAVADYRDTVEEPGTDAQTHEMLAAADAWNRRLCENNGGYIAGLSDAQREEYGALLDVENGTGVMGYLSIPKIGLELPIYHGTGDAALQAGAGHMEGSSLPVGGESTHAVLTGHTGLPSSKLFTDLDQIDVGDRFTITVLDRANTYEVCAVEVLLPEDVRLTIEEGSDDCTLLTCTPIGINTHRLLVHAHNVENTGGI